MLNARKLTYLILYALDKKQKLNITINQSCELPIYYGSDEEETYLKTAQNIIDNPAWAVKKKNSPAVEELLKFIQVQIIGGKKLKKADKLTASSPLNLEQVPKSLKN